MTGSRSTHWWARGLVVAGLAVDVVVHWKLAGRFDTLVSSQSPHISQGQLFRVETVLALVALLLVLFLPRWWTALIAFLVAAGGTAAVLLYAYVNVGAIGPLPNMSDPTWYPEKTISVVAEGIAAVAAAWWLWALLRERRTSAAR